jgi:iron complex outermembrane receptor protein
MKKLFTLVLLIFSAAIVTRAQNAQIKGTVRDADSNEPLAGASIKFDKTRGAITDASGKYTLNIPAGDHEISISFIGYKTDKIKVTLTPDEKKALDVSLKSSTFEISTVETVSQFKKNAATETVSTTVIGQDQIKNTNSLDLGEVINKTPGVLVQDGQISIRSASSYSYGVGTRTAVLQDGLPLMSADLGEAQINMAALSNVKQVEVVKGASSVVYGSGALNGVVNMISMWPTDNEPRNEFSVSTSISDRPKLTYQQWWQAPPFTNNINFNHAQRVKDIQYVIAGNITQIKSFLQFNDQLRMQTVFKLRYLHPKIEGLNFGIGGSFQYERSERFFISKDLDSNALYRGTGSDDRYIRSNLDPFVSYQNAKGHKVVCNVRFMDIFRKGNGSDPNAVSNQLIVYDQYQFRWKNMLVFTTGVPFDVAKSRSNLYSGNDLTFHAAIYGQLEFDYKFLTIQAGLRYEASGVDTIVIKNYPPVFRSGINLKASRATFFRASWGQGYRIPSIAEKYVAQQFTTDILIVPNDTLKAETSWNLELGFWQGFKIGNFKGFFDAAFFWQQSKHFIEYEVGLWPNYWGNGTKIFPDSLEFKYNPGTVLGLKPLNIENTRIAGYELNIGGTGKIGPIGISVNAGYTYTWPGVQPDPNAPDSTKYTTGQFIKDMFKYNFQRVGPSDTSRILEARIRHLVRADIELSYWKFYLGTTFAYAATPEKIPPLFEIASALLFHDGHALDKYTQQHIHGDFVMDLRAGMRVNEHIKLGFIVKNVTNLLYELRPGKPEPLRNFTLQFSYIFGATKAAKN